MKRRLFLALPLGLPLALPAMAALPAQASERLLRVWRDPNCGCCGVWIQHMRRAGFRVEETVTGALAPIREGLGIPSDLLSCHAASVQGYVLEGHVPPEAVLQLLERRPARVRGLAVPGMPAGSPGMEAPQHRNETYDVIAFGGRDERRVFMRFHGPRRLA